MNQAAIIGKEGIFNHTAELAQRIGQVKAKMKKTWSDGDYARFAKYMENGAIEVLEEWNIQPDTDLLDIGCGSGQTAIPSAKKGINVTGIDIAENLIDVARKRAERAKLSAQFDVGDAENLPYAAEQFDTLISMFGAMFAPRPEQVIEEFSRVLRPGGKLIMANWTPSSMPAQMFKCVAEVVPPATGVASPILWGVEDVVHERLVNEFTDIKLTKKTYPQWHYPFSAVELVQLFRENFGPVKRAFEVSDDAGKQQLHQKLEDIYRTHSQVSNGILTITGGEFMEVVATRR